MVNDTKKSGSGGLILTIAVVAAVLLAVLPTNLWTFLAVGVAAYIAYKLEISRARSKRTVPDESLVESHAALKRATLPAQATNRATSSAARLEPSVVPPPAAPPTPTRMLSPLTFAPDESNLQAPSPSPSPSPSLAAARRIPDSPAGYGPGVWIPKGQTVQVAGVSIPGGMVYVGTSLKAHAGGNDPCLIDASKSVSTSGDFTQRQFGYWPSYSDISAGARRSYLNWLADGRRDPEADIGYVFLFFYGLERRAILDAAQDPNAKKDWPDIAAELRRLLDIYGKTSGSFRGYAGNLLNIVQLSEHADHLYKKPVPEFPKSYELPMYVKLALGQCAVDGVPVPAHLALAWIRLSPDTFLRTPARRCALEFEKLFTAQYKQTLGEGLALPRNKTKLKLVYNPASAGFRGVGEISLTAEGVPDVTVLTAPYKKLLPIAEAATKALEGYSRYIGKNPEAGESLEALLQLPPALWPESAQQALQKLKQRMGAGMLTLSLQELVAALDAKAAPTNEKVRSLARAMESLDVGVEPDILGSAKVPKPDDPVVLFHMPAGEAASRSTPAYQAAVLTLQLASAVAAADGEFGAAEVGHLRKTIDSWTHLTLNHHRRLLAHLRLLMKAPVSLASLKKKLEPLDAPAREAIAAFMATVAQADGTVSPAEVKALEKIYKALGVESKKVFSDVHAATSATAVDSAKPAAIPAAKTSVAGFTLDAERIAALQRDSDKVSALLANIFREEEAVEAKPVVAEAMAPEDEGTRPEGLLGLDDAHTAFARMLLTRQAWTRAELLDAAGDLELMLDGALERLNEAAFDKFDMAFTDGDDPVEVNHEVLEHIAA